MARDRTPTRRRPTRRLPSALVALLALVVGGTALLGWSEAPRSPAATSAASTPATSPSRAAAALPPGWQAVAYGRLLFAMPPSWKVAYQKVCPGASRTGELDMGPVPLAFCPEYTDAVGYVVVQPAHGTPWYLQTSHRTKVNGLVVYVDDRVPLQWYLPSSGLELYGGGPDASAVLHSVRPLTWTELSRRTSATTAVGSLRHRAPAPGWKPVGYGRLLLAVPARWQVEYAPPCPAGAYGVIDIGDREGSASSCPLSGPGGRLLVVPLPPSISVPTFGRPTTVDGVTVDVHDQRFADGRTVYSWSLPSLGTQLSGTGPQVAAALYSLALLSRRGR